MNRLNRFIYFAYAYKISKRTTWRFVSHLSLFNSTASIDSLIDRHRIDGSVPNRKFLYFTCTQQVFVKRCRPIT